MSTYYSRSTNIELIVQSLQRLRGLCEGSNHLELSDTFVIRIKIMQHLAQLAFNYSLTVSYLDEQKEYAPMADLLDDVYLQLPRKNLQYISNDYRKIVSIEFDELCSVIDLMDERLKTIRVVCFNRRSCQKPRRSRRPKRNGNTKTEPAHWLDANGRRMRVPPNHTEPTPEKEEEEEEEPYSPMNKRSRIYFDCYDSEDSVDPEFAVFYTKMKTFTKGIADITYGSNKETFVRDPTDRLIQQCAIMENMFNHIYEKTEYISNCAKLRSQKPDRLSYMQMCIHKCVELANKLNEMYDAIRSKNARSNPTLRAAKSSCLKVIQKTQKRVSEEYLRNKVEPESLEYIINHPLHAY